MTKYTKHTAGEDGWSDSVNPIKRGYKLACCDCGLVHDVDFDVVRFESDTGPEHKVIDDKRIGVMFKVRRNNRATGQIRRHKKP